MNYATDNIFLRRLIDVAYSPLGALVALAATFALFWLLFRYFPPN